MTQAIPPIPSVEYPAGFTVPTPSAASSNTVLPPLPAGYQLPDLSAPNSSSDDIASDIAAGGTGVPASGGLGYGAGGATAQNVAANGPSATIYSAFTAYIKGVALPATLSLVALALILFSIYIAVTRQ